MDGGTGNVLATYDYKAFGGILNSTLNTTDFPNYPDYNSRSKYIDKEKDAESQTHNFGVRQYEDFAGRFLCPDKMWEQYDAWTVYHYCGNNPISGSDPSGLLFNFTSFTSPGLVEWGKESVNKVIDYLGKGGILSRILGAIMINVRNDPNTTLYFSIQKFGEGKDDFGVSGTKTPIIEWMPNCAYQDKDAKLSPAVGLMEEFVHYLDWVANPNAFEDRKHTSDEKFKNKEEKMAKEAVNQILKELGIEQMVDHENYSKYKVNEPTDM